MPREYATYKAGFDPAVLRDLVLKSGLSYREISRATGVPMSTISVALRGASVGVSFLLTFADYFGVSLDALCGREKVPEEFERNFMYLRRLDYEAAIRKGNTFSYTREKNGRCGEGPYPYNLLDAVSGAGLRSRKPSDCWQTVLTADQEAGFYHALSLLPDRLQDILCLYFEEGESLEEIGQVYGITRERVRQLISKGIRHLRHPVLFNLIRYGRQGSREKDVSKVKEDAGDPGDIREYL